MDTLFRCSRGHKSHMGFQPPEIITTRCLHEDCPQIAVRQYPTEPAPATRIILMELPPGTMPDADRVRMRESLQKMANMNPGALLDHIKLGQVRPTARELAAFHALQGLLACPHPNRSPSESMAYIPLRAVEYADATIEQLAKVPPHAE